MDFQTTLDSLLERIQGSVGALLLDPQGIPLALARRDTTLDLEEIGVRYSLLLGEVLRLSDRREQGILRRLIVEMEKATLLIFTLHRGFSLFLLLAPDGEVGRGIFEARKAVFTLNQQM